MTKQSKGGVLALSLIAAFTMRTYAADSRFSLIDFPSATSTTSWNMNSRGDIVGVYVSGGVSHGFLRSGGKFTTIDYPDSALTIINGINAGGDIVGEYATTATGPHHGFVQTREGAFTAIDYPGSTSSAGIGINSRGDILGLYTTPDNATHSFFLKFGRFTSIDYPGATATVAGAINNQGDIVGGYALNGNHAFLLSQGNFTSFDAPGANFTNATGITSLGDIVGRFRDTANVSHAYLLGDGQFTTIDYPGATFTGATAIDSAGNILGRTTVSGVNHGFLYATAEPEHRRYRITDLGPVGGPPGQPFYVNNSSVVSGAAVKADGTAQAVIWYRGFRGDLGGSLLGGQNSQGGTINESAELVGLAETATQDPNQEDFCGFKFLQLPTRGTTCLPFLWRSGVATALPTLGGPNGIGVWNNNRGQVSGTAENTKPDPKCPGPQKLEFKPVVWENGKVRELPTLAGDTVGVATSINDLGDVVGVTGECAEFNPLLFFNIRSLHAVMWQGNKAIDLGNLGGTGRGPNTGNVAIAINNLGEVVGNSDLPGDQINHGFLWTKRTGIQDLGTLEGDVLSGGLGINDRSEVVGISLDKDFNGRAYFWKNGVMTDLNTLVPADSPLFLFLAIAINNRGEITGVGLTSKGEPHAYLATPVTGLPDSIGLEFSGVPAPKRMPLGEDARRMLEQMRFGRFAARPIGRR